MGRRWLPWKPRLRRPPDVDVPLDAIGFIDELPAFVAVVIAVAGAALFLFFIVPLLITLAEVLLLGLLVALGVLVRVLLRRPWIVDAVRLDRTERLSWKVVGWRRSGEVVDAVAGQLAAGQATPAALPDAAPC